MVTEIIQAVINLNILALNWWLKGCITRYDEGMIKPVTPSLQNRNKNQWQESSKHSPLAICSSKNASSALFFKAILA